MPNSPLKLQQSVIFQDLSTMNNNEQKLLTINSRGETISFELSDKRQQLSLPNVDLKNRGFKGWDNCLDVSSGSPSNGQESKSTEMSLKLSSSCDTLHLTTSLVSESPNGTLELKQTENENSVQSEQSDISESELENVKPRNYIKIKTSALFNKAKKLKSLTVKSETNINKSKSPEIGSDSDSELISSRSSFSNSPLCEALELRQKNINERDAFLKSLLVDPDFAEAADNIGLFNQKQEKPPSSTKPKKKRQHKDNSFRFTGYIPTEKRKSLRLQDKEPIFKYDDLIDDTSYSKRRKRSNSSDDDFEYADLEKVVHNPRNRTNHRAKAVERTNYLKVEDVTENMIEQIAWRVSDKKYSTAGSSCHQCRQKTLDTKTICRDERCIGVRGQFCGVCLENRYGENAATALKDPNWSCPVCRGICNCSFCRSKAGKRPTGILTPIAHRSGHKSVKDFLDSLRGKGDYTDETKDPSKLLGFSDDLKYAQMGGDVKHFVGNSTDLVEFNNVIDLLRKKLTLL